MPLSEGGLYSGFRAVRGSFGPYARIRTLISSIAIMMMTMAIICCLLASPASPFTMMPSVATTTIKPMVKFSPTARPQPISLTALRLSSTVTSSSPQTTVETLNQVKATIVRLCDSDTKPSRDQIRDLVQELEETAEQLGIGQASSISGLLSGEWELLYANQDVTRSSPFFWAFRKAVPNQADQIFQITDAIPAPIKAVGPVNQQIDWDSTTQTGRLVSRVKVATLGGLATSIMTTRAAITGLQGVDGLTLKIETTKPEQSTLVKTVFGPLGDVVNENAPAFPSGQALEQIQPGSSTVTMRTSFCDEGLRISRNDEDRDSLYIWRRRQFASYEFL